MGTQVDVLQCLAVALFGVLAVAWIFAEKKWYAAGLVVLAGLALGTVLLAPFSAGWSGGPVPVAAFVNGRTGSLFPLFPWAAFVFCGALGGAAEGRGTVWLLGAAAGVRVAAGLAGDGTFSALSPVFFGERLAWVLALAALCQWIARGWTPRVGLFAGRESLVMYAAHFLTPPAAPAISPTREPPRRSPPAPRRRAAPRPPPRTRRAAHPPAPPTR